MGQKIFDLDKFKKLARRAVAEGIVLLKNDDEILPLKPGTKIALFGRSQFNYYKSGTGSGGMVNTKYVTGVKEALENDGRYVLNEELMEAYNQWIKDNPFDEGCGWASEPWFQEEMPISFELAKNAAIKSDIAIILIGRTAGEDQDNKDSKGSYLLTDSEEMMLRNVTAAFDNTIVLINTGNIIDMKWVEVYNPKAVAYIWQGGQEGGLGVLDVISGDVNPSGRLTDTIAKNIANYPSDKNFGGSKQNIQQEDIYVGYRYFETFAKDNVLYPFGYGLSYTNFNISVKRFNYKNKKVEIEARVENTGNRKGQQVVQVYVSKPQGKLGAPSRELVAFAKTKELAPGENEIIDIVFTDYQFSSYDDSGETGNKSAYVLEEGVFTFYIGSDVRTDIVAGEIVKDSTCVIDQLTEALAPTMSFERIKPKAEGNGNFTMDFEYVPKASYDQADLRKLNLPKELINENKATYKLVDVYDGKCSIEDFVSQLSDEELCCIARGEGMSSPKVTAGCGGAFGGVTDSLLEKGIPVACCTDGPSGIRMDSGKKAFAMPNGTCLASAWNLDLTEKLYGMEGLELRKNKIDVLLGPGMNLHRHPLNGRNFEYFSEDPLVTGKNGAAQLRGMHKYGVTGTIKHFAMNTQETGRHKVEHIASERAIREIYLKGFEIAVKEGNAHAVMTTYGVVNGYYTSSNYDLVTRILRDEWGFDGIVMTDWWAKCGLAQQGNPADLASMIRAQNDLYMVTTSAKDNTNKDNLLEELEAGLITRGELQRTAINICKFIMGKPVFARYINRNNELDLQLENEVDEDDVEFDNMIDVRIGDEISKTISPKLISTSRNSSNLISLAVKDRGDYELNMTVRANANSELAQIPLSIFRDNSLVKMITLTGADVEWQTITIPLKDCTTTLFLKFYFAQDGMEIKDITISLVESKEEQIRLMLARMGE